MSITFYPERGAAQMPDYKLLPEVITSEVCVRCGMCCKSTHYEETKHVDDMVDYLERIYGDTADIIATDRDQVKVVKWCEKLYTMYPPSHFPPDPEKEVVFRKCTVYAKRPSICRDFNCFERANSAGTPPEYLDFILSVIHHVHGNIPWHEGQTPDPKVDQKAVD